MKMTRDEILSLLRDVFTESPAAAIIRLQEAIDIFEKMPAGEVCVMATGPLGMRIIAANSQLLGTFSILTEDKS